ncbi:MAG TPA: phosphoribosylaminoimidazolesuccinocarboxamide synthase [Anaerolineae bacterium]|nr:phosphoribosylaminoimidazolesuccinocarboxamide synthase [Anaerolineae bacterium]
MLTHEQLLEAVPHALAGVDLPGWGPKMAGKVRDSYRQDDRLLLITTDRVSAFDRVLGLIPYKGQVLNQLSAWWFAQTGDIAANHLLDVPDPNVTLARAAEPLPVEVIVRGYITGVTTTSLWYLYERGDRRPYGIPLPDGLQKNDKLPEPIIMPTTKAEKGQHDERLTNEEARALLPEVWDEIAETAVTLFKRGQALAERAGLVLVDTKYEFGLVDGRLTLIDEIHTPDSSRYWVADSYQPGGGEPESFDKEFLRKWFVAQGYRGEGQPPVMPADFIAQVAARYIAAYERLTGQEFVPGAQPAAERILAAVGNL